MQMVEQDRKETWMSYIVTGGSNVFVITERKNVRKKALNMNRGISEYEPLEEARSYSLV